MKTRLLQIILPLALLTAARGGTHVWSGAGANTSWSNPSNWSSGGVPVAGEAAPVKLVFPANATSRTSSLNISNLKVDAIEVDLTGGHYTFPTAGIPVTLTGAAGDNFKVTGVLGSVTWQPAITLQATCRVNLGGSANLDIQGVVAGSGGLTKQGSGFLLFTTSGVANTFTGAMRLEGGNLTFRKLPGAACFGGKLELAGGNCNIERSHQIPDNAAIEIAHATLSTSPATGTGALNETLGNVMLKGTSALKAQGDSTVTLAGSVATSDLVLTSSAISASGNGAISLGSGSKTIFIPRADSRISIDAVVGNGAAATGIVKTGAGDLRLTRANTFTGPVDVQGGQLRVGNASALGTSAGGITVREGASMFVEVAMSLVEALDLQGSLHTTENMEIPGAVTIGGSPVLDCSMGKTLKLKGVISGNPSQLLIDGAGTIEFSGSQSNTYTAITKVEAGGTLALGKTNALAVTGPVDLAGGSISWLAGHQIADTVPVWFSSFGTLSLNGFSESVLTAYGAGGGNIHLGNGMLTFLANTSGQLGTSDHSITITGTAASSIRKKGTGTWTLYRSSSQPGDANAQTALYVDAGWAKLNGYWPGAIHVTGGTLEGSAETGVIDNQGGTINLSTMKVQGLDTPGMGGTLASTLYSEVPGSGFGMLKVTGGINLTGMSLNLSVNYLPMTGSTYTILENDGTDPVMGSFNGLPEGAVFSVNGRPFTITYKAGMGGNDVMIRFIGTGTPGPEITSVRPLGNGWVQVSMKWEPGKTVTLERAYGDLEHWGPHVSCTMDAQGKATENVQVFGSKAEFFRLRTNPQ
jgi:fibronectin-binding autotransporter adhesin